MPLRSIARVIQHNLLQDSTCVKQVEQCRMRYHISQKVLVDTYERKAAATITDAAIRQAIPCDA